jgi:hypothetical protein
MKSRLILSGAAIAKPEEGETTSGTLTRVNKEGTRSGPAVARLSLVKLATSSIPARNFCSHRPVTGNDYLARTVRIRS